jgi:RNA polymerase sigma-70 factor (ECF subfamily)
MAEAPPLAADYLSPGTTTPVPRHKPIQENEMDGLGAPDGPSPPHPRHGGVEEFELVALPHIENVGRFALSLTRNETDADDLVQETFLRAFRGWHTFTPGTDCRRWLFTICRNTFISMKRRKPVYVQSDEGDLDAMPAAVTHMRAVSEGIADAFEQIDVRPAIEAAVRALPEPHHSIVVLVDLEGLSYEEAAAVLQIPVGTVRSRLYRARRHVQEALLAHARDMGIASGSGRHAIPA